MGYLAIWDYLICNFSKILHIVRYNVTMLQCYIRNFEMLQEILVYYLYYILYIYNHYCPVKVG